MVANIVGLYINYGFKALKVALMFLLLSQATTMKYAA
jgi:hypothetical protein